MSTGTPMTSATIELAPQQAEAVKAITDWFTNPAKQVYRLFGYAGTGKTTLARHIVDQLGVRRVAYAAFTGKAAYVLRQKGCENASTVHSLIYQPIEKARAELVAMQQRVIELAAMPDPCVEDVDELATPHPTQGPCEPSAGERNQPAPRRVMPRRVCQTGTGRAGSVVRRANHQPHPLPRPLCACA